MLERIRSEQQQELEKKEKHRHLQLKQKGMRDLQMLDAKSKKKNDYSQQR